jgi:hypothetical protein
MWMALSDPSSPKDWSNHSTTAITTTTFRMLFDFSVHRDVVVDEPMQARDAAPVDSHRNAATPWPCDQSPDADATNRAKQPQHEQDDQHEAENSCEATATVTIVAVVTAAATQ